MARHPVRNCKCYTLSVLAMSVALSAAVSIVLVEMSPARMHFSIPKATHSTSSDGGLELNITLVANTSPRVWVLYRRIYVVFCNNNHGREIDATCIGTDVAQMPLLQKPESPKKIYPAVVLERADSPWVSLGIMPSQESFMGNKSFDSIKVNVNALVRFKRPGIPWTSLHNINVSCAPITFTSQANKSSDGVMQNEIFNNCS